MSGPLRALLFILTAVTAGASAAGAGEVARIPFHFVDNRVFIPVTLDGHGPYEFILDTGAPGWGISGEVMQQLKLKSERREAVGGAGEAKDTAEALHIDTVGVGPGRFRRQAFNALPFGMLNNVIGFTRFDGIAGKPVFDAYMIGIDFAAKELSLSSPGGYTPPPGAIVVPFTFYDGAIPLVEARIDGVAGRFIVDLGDRSSLTLFGPFWRAHRLDKAMAPAVDALTGYGIGGPIRGLVVRTRALEIGRARVTNIIARLSLQRSGGFADPAIAGSIGTGVLKHFRVTFDYAARRMVLVPDPAMAASDRYDRAGLWLGRAPAGFAVYDTVAGGPAARAGLRTGDIVTAVDGKPAGTLDLFALRTRLADPNAGDTVVMTYRRGGKEATATLALRDLLPQTR